MTFKKITLLSGHYGSGKTNVAVNLAVEMKKYYNNLAIADLDIVNPYFRTKDSEKVFKERGIRLICSPYANSNLDIPALPQDMYAITDDPSLYSIVDVGGDERGALALGRLSDKINALNNYDMFMVINCYRPLTRTAKETLEVMREIEDACRIKFTGLINNSNLGEETTAKDVSDSFPYAREMEKVTGLKIAFTSVKKDLINKIKSDGELFPLTLQEKII